MKDYSTQTKGSPRQMLTTNWRKSYSKNNLTNSRSLKPKAKQDMSRFTSNRSFRKIPFHLFHQSPLYIMRIYCLWMNPEQVISPSIILNQGHFPSPLSIRSNWESLRSNYKTRIQTMITIRPKIQWKGPHNSMPHKPFNETHWFLCLLLRNHDYDI